MNTKFTKKPATPVVIFFLSYTAHSTELSGLKALADDTVEEKFALLFTLSAVALVKLLGFFCSQRIFTISCVHIYR